MKKTLISIIVVAMFFVSFASYAQEAPNYARSSIDKAQRGLTNVLTGWLELPFQVHKGYKNGARDGELKLLGGLFGVVRGITHGLGRTATGAYQLVTFILPNPKSNEGVGLPLDGHYAWDEGEQYSIPEEGVSPIGKKAMRGLSNTFLGALDGPGQFIKGMKNDKPWVGLANSIIFPVSRVLSGVYDISTALLPGSQESYGYPLEEKNAWDAFPDGEYYTDLK